MLSLLELHCKAMNLPTPCTEHRFHPPRRWRCDYSWPEWKLAVEIEGGVFIPGGSRHSRGAGYRKDCEKYNRLAIMGWHVLRFLPEQVKSGEAVRTIEEYFLKRKEEVK